MSLRRVLHGCVASAALIALSAPASAQKPDNMPDEDYREIVATALRVVQLPDNTSVDLTWNSGQTGHYGHVTAVGPLQREPGARYDCRAFQATLNYNWQNQDKAAAFRGSYCIVNNRWELQNLTLIAGAALPDFDALRVQTYRNSAGDTCRRDPVNRTDRCTDPCGREYAAAAGRPELPAPRTQTYTNNVGDTCRRTVRTVEENCRRREVEEKTCTAGDGSTYVDDGTRALPPAREEAFTNRIGDACQRRTETVVENGQRQEKVTETCTDRNGRSYANGNPPPADPAMMTSIQRMLARLLYLPEAAISGTYDAATRAAITAFLADEGATSLRADSDVARQLALAVDRTENVARSACEIDGIAPDMALGVCFESR